MDIIQIGVKIILPILLFFQLAWFKAHHKDAKFLPLFLLWGLFCLSSNDIFLFSRQVYNGIEILAILTLIHNIFIRRFRWKPVMNNFVIFIIFILLSYLNVNDRGFFFNSLINYIVCCLVTLYLFTVLNEKKQFYFFFRYLGNSTLILAISTILVFPVVRDRIELCTFNSNYLAYFLALGLACFIFRPAYSKRDYLNIFLFIIAILFTESRGIILAVLLLILFRLIQRPAWLLVLVPLLIITGSLVINNLDKLGINRFSNESQTGDYERVAIYFAAYGMIKEYPLTGIGYGQFFVRFHDFVPTVYAKMMKRDEIVTHNDFLRILVETGIFSFIIMISISIKQGLRSFMLKKTVLSFITALFIVNILFFFTHDNINSFIAWFLLFLPGWYWQTHLTNKKDKPSAVNVSVNV